MDIFSAIINVIQNNATDELDALIAAGVDMGAQDMNGDLPLQYACWMGSLYSVNALIAAGADVNTPDKDGTFPMHMS